MTLLEQREADAEAQRVQNWDVFVAGLRDHAHARGGWGGIRLYLLDAIFKGISKRAHDEALDFEGQHSFPELLRALAQAWQADDTAQREAFERR